MASPIVWFEVLGSNHAASRRFYTELFQWTFQDMDEMPYSLLDGPGKGEVGGGVGQAPDGKGWSTFYVGVQNIEESVDAATKLGAKVLMPITDLPDTRIAVIADPDGHPVGLAQSHTG